MGRASKPRLARGYFLPLLKDVFEPQIVERRAASLHQHEKRDAVSYLRLDGPDSPGLVECGIEGERGVADARSLRQCCGVICLGR